MTNSDYKEGEKKTTSNRNIAIIASVALVIAIVGLVSSFGVGKIILGIEDQRDVVVARGTLSVDTPLTCFPPFVTTGCVSIQTVEDGSKTIYIGDFFITQSGDLPGHVRELQMITVDGTIRTASIRGFFTGSFGGVLGTYSFLGSSISDLSQMEINGTIMFEGNWTIVEGSGTGGFEGVCGFATFSLNDVITVEKPPLPNITNVFAFGNDCEDFDVGDFLGILNDDDST